MVGQDLDVDRAQQLLGDGAGGDSGGGLACAGPFEHVTRVGDEPSGAFRSTGLTPATSRS